MKTIQEQIKKINALLDSEDSLTRALMAMGGTWKGSDMVTVSDNELANMIKNTYIQKSIYMEQWVALNDELNSTEEKKQITGAEKLKPKLYSLRFYADGTEGGSDKLFCYPVHHGGHTADLLTRFIERGLTIKAAYLVGGLGGDRKVVQLGRGELAYLTCTGEKEKNRIRAILMSKFPELN